MDMDADKTSRLIASAIAALPYRRPSAGFSARVMAEIAAEARPWQAQILKAAGLMMTAWVASLGFVSARLAYANLPEAAALLIQPGGCMQALNVLAARTVLMLSKAAAAVSLGSDVLAAAAAGLPAWYEIGAAAVICSVAIAALAKSGRLARQGI